MARLDAGNLGRESGVIRLEIRAAARVDLARGRFVTAGIDGSLPNVRVGQSSVLSAPGYSAAPDGSRFKSTTKRECVAAISVMFESRANA